MKNIQKTKGTVCCVRGCTSDTGRNRDVSFHKFPKDEKIRKIWIQRVNRKGCDSSWEPTKNHRICGLHFNKSGKKAYEDKYPRFFPYKTYPLAFYERVVVEGKILGHEWIGSTFCLDFSSCYSRSVGNEVIVTNESETALSSSSNGK